MAEYYNPDPGAVALQQDERFPRLLSQRDLSLRVPINYVPFPGVVLTPACFANGRYDNATFARCFSNLLGTGFRKIEADVFWDVSRGQWSLCPVQLGGDDGLVTAPANITTTVSPQSPTHLSTNVVSVPADFEPRSAMLELELVKRQTSDTSTSPTIATPTTNSLTTTAQKPAAITTTAVNGSTVIQIGPYSCSPETNLELLISILSGYLTSTQTWTNASTTFLTLNLHVAASASDPTGAAQQLTTAQLPQPGSALGLSISANSSGYLYTPTNLFNQRSNLNTSGGWFGVDAVDEPEASYLDIEINGSHISSRYGWPSESYIDIQNGQRLLVAFGEIDPQISDYNFTQDEDTIFASNFLFSPRAVITTAEGDITSGCFFDQSEMSLSKLNSSWATSSVGNNTVSAASSLDPILREASNLVTCGISPILNSTLNGVTADQNHTLYTTFIQNTVWSWAPGEPVNASGSTSDDLDDHHCATLNSTSGHWQASDCGDSHYCACRLGSAPYAWEISSDDAPYARVDLACGDNSTFDVPRTGLENEYLLSVWRTARFQRDDLSDSGPLLWLNFNDQDVSACWVIGADSLCPYVTPTNKSRQVIVPAIAGVVVAVIVILTVLLKCVGNRRNARRGRRRREDGWDYEGVPS